MTMTSPHDAPTSPTSRSVRRIATDLPLDAITSERGLDMLRAGIEFITHPTAVDLLIALASDDPDAVITSAQPSGVALPEFIAAVRRFNGVPVIIALATGGETNALAAAALEADASALLPVPCGADEMRRALGSLGLPSAPHAASLEIGGLRIDVSAHRVYWDETEVRLTQREFAILQFMAARAPRLVSADDISRQFTPHGDLETATRAVRVMIGNIRAKLGAASPTGATPIETVRGLGYRVSDAPQQSASSAH